MKYIDKSVHLSQGQQIVDQLLLDAWSDDDHLYHRADYDGLSQTKYKSTLLSNLLQEQQNSCCYCLKEISEGETTIEHLIPQNETQTMFSRYLTVPELENNVLHLQSFDRRIKIIPPDKYPHDIAYHNLLASCNSKSHCNNYRKSKFIQPLVYDEDIMDQIIYDENGRAGSEKYGDEIDHVGISTDRNLIFIRKVWRELATRCTYYDLIDAETIDGVILDLIADSQEDSVALIDNFTGEPSYKNEILRYKWFYNYYTLNHNI